MPTRRLTARTLLALPLLVGGLLLMHGLEATVGGGHPGHGGQLVASGHDTDSHDEAPASQHEGVHCPDCWADVLTACLGVLVGLVTLCLVRGWAGTATLSVALLAATRRSRERWELWHPPEPAWLRLSVMRR